MEYVILIVHRDMPKYVCTDVDIEFLLFAHLEIFLNIIIRIRCSEFNNVVALN